jgi:hypothetical protein
MERIHMSFVVEDEGIMNTMNNEEKSAWKAKDFTNKSACPYSVRAFKRDAA